MAWLPLSSGFQSTPSQRSPRATSAERGLEHEQPQHAGDGGRHRIGPDQQRLVDAGALDGLSACTASSSAIDSDSTVTAMEKIAVVPMAR